MSVIADKVLSGDIRAAARLISGIDNGDPGVRPVLKELYPYTGNAYVVGVTGAPGVGKSTLVNQMLVHLRKKGKTVGIIAIDPTSPFTGGAILGDRIRMQQHSCDEGVFIRSLATRGHFGGITHSTRSTIDVLDAMGKDFIIIETVGVGQDEVEIVKSAHTTVIMVIPGMGDDIQAIKAGILEAGDIFVVNKSDRDGADRTMNDLNTMIEMGNQGREKGTWKPVVLKAEAVNDQGITGLIEEISRHRTHLRKAGENLNLRLKRERVREELAEMVKSRLIHDVFKRLIESGEFEKSVESIIKGDSSPYDAVDRLIPAEPVLS